MALCQLLTKRATTTVRAAYQYGLQMAVSTAAAWYCCTAKRPCLQVAEIHIHFDCIIDGRMARHDFPSNNLDTRSLRLRTGRLYLCRL